MSLQIKIVTSPADYPALAHIKYLAFASNTLNQLMYPPSISPQSLQSWFVEREKRDAQNPFQRIVAVVDTEKENEIIAHAKWELPSTLVRNEDGDEVKHVELGPVPKVPEGGNEEIWGMFRGGVDGMREKWGNKEEVFGTLRGKTIPVLETISSFALQYQVPLNSPSSAIHLEVIHFNTALTKDRAPFPSHAPLAPRTRLRWHAAEMGN